MSLGLCAVNRQYIALYSKRTGNIMRKISCGLDLCLLSIIFCSTAFALPVEVEGRFGIGADVGCVFPNRDKAQQAAYIGGNITYGISNYIVVGAEAGYIKWDEEDNGVDYGDVIVVPILGDIYIRCPIDIEKLDSTLAPYVIGGLGGTMPSYEESAFLNANGVSVEFDPALAAKLGAGFDYFLTDKVAVNFEGSYIWAGAEAVTDTAGTITTSNEDLDWWMIKGGVKFFF